MQRESCLSPGSRTRQTAGFVLTGCLWESRQTCAECSASSSTVVFPVPTQPAAIAAPATAPNISNVSLFKRSPPISIWIRNILPPLQSHSHCKHTRMLQRLLQLCLTSQPIASSSVLRPLLPQDSKHTSHSTAYLPSSKPTGCNCPYIS